MNLPLVLLAFRINGKRHRSFPMLKESQKGKNRSTRLFASSKRETCGEEGRVQSSRERENLSNFVTYVGWCLKLHARFQISPTCMLLTLCSVYLLNFVDGYCTRYYIDNPRIHHCIMSKSHFSIKLSTLLVSVTSVEPSAKLPAHTAIISFTSFVLSVMCQSMPFAILM